MTAVYRIGNGLGKRALMRPEEALLFEQQMATLLPESEKISVMELTTSWKEEGIEIGRDRERQLVLSQLRKRFGALEPEWGDRIGQYSFDQLGELGEALLDFKSRVDLKNWMAAH